MMIFQIQLAGTVIEITSVYPSVAGIGQDYEVIGKKPSITVHLGQDAWDEEWRIDTSKNNLKWISEQRKLSNYLGRAPTWESRAIYRKIFDTLPSFHIFCFHSAVVVQDGYAYAFTAPSGTGKSTRANLFLKRFPSSFILNGDKPLLRLEEDRVVACGSPWTGKERQGVNAEAPLKAIFLLERANETELAELKMKDAFDFLLHQTYLPKDGKQMLKTLELIKSMEGKVKLFRFRSEPTEESVEAAWWAANRE